jgi:multidrug resistance efflux pump
MKSFGFQKIVRSRLMRIVLAASLFATGAWGFAPYVFTDVSTRAAINAPLIRLTAASDGTVADLPADGQFFAHPTLLKLQQISQDTGEVADLQAQADLAEAQIALSRRQLGELQVQEARLNQRASLFTAAMNSRLAQDGNAAAALLAGCAATRTEHRAALDRVRKLAVQGFASQAGVDKAMAAASQADSDCLAATAKLRSIQVQRNAASRGVFLGDNYNDAPYSVQQADRLLLQRQMIEKTLTDATAQYRQTSVRLKEALARSSYRAPAGTLVWATSASPGTSIRAGEPVIDLLDCRNRFVQVALPERRAEAIAPGDPADIRMIGSSTWLKGRVVNITGAAGRRRQELLATATYSKPGDQEIMIDVALPPPTLDRLDPSRKCEVGRQAEVRLNSSF